MPKQKLLTIIWRFLISLRLTLFLLFVLAGACIIGTVVPQNASQAEYIGIFGEKGFHLIEACLLYDLFSSWWFQLTMAFLALNLICCTLHRAPRVWRTLHRSRELPDSASLETMSCCRTTRLQSFDSGSEERFARELGAAFGRPEIQRQEDRVTLFSEKGRWSRLGFLLTHTALLLIMGGSVLGHLGFKGFMQLYEGQQSDAVVLSDRSGTQPLDFTLRCNSFEVKFYENTGRPQSYLSSLTVIENGQEVLTKEIRVNDPLIYKGIFFYQSTYGTDPNGGGTLHFSILASDATDPQTVHVDVGSSVMLPGTQDEFFVDNFLADFALDEHNHPFSRSRNLNNPAVLLRAERDGEPLFTSWLFARHPDFHGSQTASYQISITNFEPRYFTGLQVAKDPGVGFVWVGCAFLLAGMYIAFFCSHRRVWVYCERKQDGFRVIVAGEANKNKDAFKKDFSALCERLLT
jgi:cytochrome c biogenesis protein